MQIQNGIPIDTTTVVTLKYQLFAVEPTQPSDKILIEERLSDNPLEFLYGQKQLLTAVEAHLLQQTPGHKAELRLPPKDAFGLYREDLRVKMPQEKFPKDVKLTLGMKFQTQGPEGQVISVIVKEIHEDYALVDGNHPLAGLGIFFDLEVLRVRKATPDELAQKKAIPFYH